jgi:hypothetical protein
MAIIPEHEVEDAQEPPIADYEALPSAEVIARLGGLTPAELRALREHERRNANRGTVLLAIARRLG